MSISRDRSPVSRPVVRSTSTAAGSSTSHNTNHHTSHLLSGTNTLGGGGATTTVATAQPILPSRIALPVRGTSPGPTEDTAGLSGGTTLRREQSPVVPCIKRAGQAATVSGSGAASPQHWWRDPNTSNRVVPSSPQFASPQTLGFGGACNSDRGRSGVPVTTAAVSKAVSNGIKPGAASVFSSSVLIREASAEEAPGKAQSAHVLPYTMGEVTFEPAVPRPDGRPMLKMHLSQNSTMRQVREALGIRLGVDPALVQLIAGSSGGRFSAFEDSERLGTRRKLHVLGVDLPTSARQGPPSAFATPAIAATGIGGAVQRPAAAVSTAGFPATTAAASPTTRPTTAVAATAAQSESLQPTSSYMSSVPSNQAKVEGGDCLTIHQGKSSGITLTLQGVSPVWSIADVRRALAREAQRPVLLERGRFVRQTGDGRLMALKEGDFVQSLQPEDKVILIGESIYAGGKAPETTRTQTQQPEVLRSRDVSAEQSRAHPTISAAASAAFANPNRRGSGGSAGGGGTHLGLQAPRVMPLANSRIRSSSEGPPPISVDPVAPQFASFGLGVGGPSYDNGTSNLIHRNQLNGNSLNSNGQNSSIASSCVNSGATGDLAPGRRFAATAAAATAAAVTEIAAVAMTTAATGRPTTRLSTPSASPPPPAASHSAVTRLVSHSLSPMPAVPAVPPPTISTLPPPTAAMPSLVPPRTMSAEVAVATTTPQSQAQTETQAHQIPSPVITMPAAAPTTAGRVHLAPGAPAGQAPHPLLPPPSAIESSRASGGSTTGEAVSIPTSITTNPSGRSSSNNCEQQPPVEVPLLDSSATATAAGASAGPPTTVPVVDLTIEESDDHSEVPTCKAHPVGWPASVPTPLRQTSLGRPPLITGYVCPDCGLSGLPDLWTASAHCAEKQGDAGNDLKAEQVFPTMVAASFPEPSATMDGSQLPSSDAAAAHATPVLPEAASSVDKDADHDKHEIRDDGGNSNADVSATEAVPAGVEEGAPKVEEVKNDAAADDESGKQAEKEESEEQQQQQTPPELEIGDDDANDGDKDDNASSAEVPLVEGARAAGSPAKGYVCPDCGLTGLPDLASASTHCYKPEQQVRRAYENPNQDPGYVCPICRTRGLASIQEAANHCQKATGSFNTSDPSPCTPSTDPPTRIPWVEPGGGSGTTTASDSATASASASASFSAAASVSTSAGAAGAPTATTMSATASAAPPSASPMSACTSQVVGSPQGSPTVQGSPTEQLRAAPVASMSSTASSQVAKGEAVAYSAQGVPTIVRQVDEESGQARTIVQNDDGSHKVFGANTVASLVGSSDDDARHWLGALRDRELHGLVHELGKRLVANSQEYAQCRSTLEAIAQRGHWDYFGLQQGASERELTHAYKKMAMRMHPDKNGGTDEAKRRFQQMKERYEALKEKFSAPTPAAHESRSNSRSEESGGSSPRARRSNSSGGGESEDEKEDGMGRFGGANQEKDSDSGNTNDEHHQSDDDTEDNTGRRGGDSKNSSHPTPAGRRREAYDEDEEPTPKKNKRKKGHTPQASRISYDPARRDSMDETVWRMLRQMRQLKLSLDQIRVEMRRTVSR